MNFRCKLCIAWREKVGLEAALIMLCAVYVYVCDPCDCTCEQLMCVGIKRISRTGNGRFFSRQRRSSDTAGSAPVR